MFTIYFSSGQALGFLLVALLHGISIYYFSFKKKIPYALFFLFIGGLTARLLLISLDPYLHLWDEQYHALVAKNMADTNSLTPVLFRETPLKFVPTIWTEAHIWLHKQPLFLWIIALSIKLFGATPFAVRLPSAIMMSLLIPVIYRMGKLAVNERTGFIGCFLFATCNYLLDFITGQYNTDHNDIAFIFFGTLSIWAYTEYAYGKKKKYIWWIGLFAGMAVLNKWLTGMLVFSGWDVSMLFFGNVADKKAEFKNILKALVICVLIFLPWQIYIFLRFPVEALSEYNYNSRHFFEVLEHHSGSYSYYFIQAVEQYGWLAAYLLPIAFSWLLWKIKNKFIRVGYLTFVVAVYAFYTMAKTKMPAFCLIVSPILFIALGNFMDNLLHYLHRIKINTRILSSFEFSVLMIIGIVSFDIQTLQAHHTDQIKNDIRAWVNKYLMHTTEVGKSIKGKYNREKTVIVNCNQANNIPMMFFSGYTAYDKIPTLAEYDYLNQNGYTVLFFRSASLGPEFIIHDLNSAFVKDVRKCRQGYLQAYNGKYLSSDLAISNKPVLANRDTPKEWETFSVLFFDNHQCSILANNNLFLSAELADKNEITATRKVNSTWETYTITELDNNRIVLKASNGKYLSVDLSTTQVYAGADAIGAREIFTIMDKK